MAHQSFSSVKRTAGGECASTTRHWISRWLRTGFHFQGLIHYWIGWMGQKSSRNLTSTLDLTRLELRKNLSRRLLSEEIKGIGNLVLWRLGYVIPRQRFNDWWIIFLQMNWILLSLCAWITFWYIVIQWKSTGALASGIGAPKGCKSLWSCP